MDKRYLFTRAIFTLLVFLGLVSRISAGKATRPNILWLIAEDMGPEALSGSGTPQVWTPNLDRLATQGATKADVRSQDGAKGQKKGKQ